MIISQCAVSGSATMLTMLRQWRILIMLRILNAYHAKTAKEDSSKAIPVTTWRNFILNLLWLMCDDFFVTLFLCNFLCKVWPVLLKNVLTSCPKSDAISMGWISYNKKSLKRLWKKYEILKILNCCLPLYSGHFGGHPWQPFTWLKRIESPEDILKAAVWSKVISKIHFTANASVLVQLLK